MKLIVSAVFIAAMLSVVSGEAVAGQYQCKVYCTGPSGTTTASVKANSSSEAAAIVDKGADQICRSAGHKAATSQSMSSSQCR